MWWAPSGLVARRRAVSGAKADAAARQNRHDRYVAISQQRTTGGDVRNYDDLLRVAIDRGVDEATLRAGSVPVESLDFVVGQVGRGPGLHVGNYAGVSLAYLAAHVDGVIVAVDPNVPFQGFSHPQDTVVRLLAAAGAQDRVVLVCGYSQSKNPSNQAWVHDDYDPATEWMNEFAPECVFENLRELGVRFGWALLDGNHDPDYLRAELVALASLLVPDGLVFIDDCNQWWPEILDVFRAPPAGWTAAGTDGRIGVLRRSP